MPVNKSARSRPRILYITPANPITPKSGAEQRSALMYEALCSVGRVDILVLSDGEDAQPRATVLANNAVMVEAKKKGAWGLTRYRADPRFTKTVGALLPHPIPEYQLAVGRYLWPISQLSIPEHVARIVDLDDFRYRYSRGMDWSAPIFAERIKKLVSHRLAVQQLHKYSGAFVVNAQDHNEITKLPTRFLPNIAYGPPCMPITRPGAHGPNLLFVGSLWYRPNAHGVHWFLERVWTDIKKIVPEAQLTLIGAAASTVRNGWEKFPGVTAPGYVDNLNEAYEKSALVIVPIHIGGGSNIKVLEALGHGRPCVVTRLTAAAFNPQLVHGQHYLVADNAQEFKQYVIEVLRQPEAYYGMAARGYESVRSQFSVENFKALVAGFVQEVLA